VRSSGYLLRAGIYRAATKVFSRISGKSFGAETGDGHAARERAVEMRVSANSTRHDDLPARIQFLCFWVQLLQLGRRPYFTDLVAFDHKAWFSRTRFGVSQVMSVAFVINMFMKVRIELDRVIYNLSAYFPKVA